MENSVQSLDEPTSPTFIKGRKPRLKPLNLSQEELSLRLASLKNYETYQRTKTKRINLSELTQGPQSSIINTALRYGGRYGKNQVLQDFVQTQGNELPQTKNQKNKIKVLIDSPHKRRKVKCSKEGPSFLQLKSCDKALQGSVSAHFEKKSLSDYSRQHCLTEPKPSPTSLKIVRTVPFPKQLVSLKKKLGLGSAPIEQKIVPNPQETFERANTLSLVSNQCPSELVSLKAEWTRPKPRLDKKIGEGQYMTHLKSILSNSQTLLTGEEESSPLRGSALSRISSVRVRSPTFSHCAKRLRYWPLYPQYSVSQSDLKKLKDLRSEALKPPSADFCEPVAQLQKLVKNQLGVQQRYLQQELLSRDIDHLGGRFGYVMELQRENYKRNVKDFIRCRKEYYLERRREEVRANGIKRLKKFREKESGLKKTIEQCPSQA